MAKVRLIKLGTMCTESASKLSGAPTHFNINGSGHMNYLFQPKRLNPETHLPVNRIRLDESRLQGITKENYVEMELPTEMIGKEVEDRISGYKGTVVSLTVHLNGCVHYVVQSAGTTKDGSPIDSIEIDPRSCVDQQSTSVKQPVSPGDPFPQG
ncbi:MAG: hypothetical protein FGM57_02925 [Candidatus Taylorbacteria bacterium]|nr:hypothetical protein [Candidatus Taylorbacteria bacterium]